jgi:hypothetical protein
MTDSGWSESGNLAQDAQHHERDGPAEVQGGGRPVQDGASVPQVGVDVAGGAGGRAGEQGAGVHQDQGVVVDVDNTALRGDPLHDLVRVARRRQAGTDVEELADARPGYQVPDGPAQERPVGPREPGDIREHRHDLVADQAVGRVVVLATQPVIPDPG